MYKRKNFRRKHSTKKSTYKSKVWMMAQYLKPDFYNWGKGNYSDVNITKYAIKFNTTANAVGYDAKSPYHYVYELYRHYYWPQSNQYQLKWRDYGGIFDVGDGHDAKANRIIAHLVYNHLVMRICYFYYVDGKRNAKKYSTKKSKTKKVGIPCIAGILHDADVGKNGDIVKPHIHIIFRFPKQITANQLSKWSGVMPQYFESNYKGRYAFDNMCAYLIHAKQPLKHLYDAKNVWSNKPYFNYQKYFDIHKGSWFSRRSQSNKLTAKWLEHQVMMGKLTLTQIQGSNKLYPIYCSDINNINQLAQAYTSRVAILTSKALKRGDFIPTVFYVWGHSGAGKTKYVATDLIDKLQRKYHWSLYKAGGTNSFDGYSGEQIVLLDDVRQNSINASDWLRLLDPAMISPISARYHNKSIADRVIVITTPQPPAQFFSFVKNTTGDEPLGQFLRRLTESIRVIRVGRNTSLPHHRPNNIRLMISHTSHLNRPIQVIVNKQDSDHYNVVSSTNFVINPNQYNPRTTTLYTFNQGIDKLVKVVLRNNSKDKNKRIYGGDSTVDAQGYIKANSKYNDAKLLPAHKNEFSNGKYLNNNNKDRSDKHDK